MVKAEPRRGMGVKTIAGVVAHGSRIAVDHGIVVDSGPGCQVIDSDPVSVIAVVKRGKYGVGGYPDLAVALRMYVNAAL